MPSNERNDETRTADSHELSIDSEYEYLPEKIGRYHIKRVLGQGGFGLVFLAQDERLDRRVAVKVPHPRLITKLEDAEAYLNEARNVATLDHPNIVPVYDVGSTDEFPCFIVSKYIDGADLAKTLRNHRLDCIRSAELIATVAEAQHHAHKLGLVHRDVKPGNILIDQDGIPFLVDFGLALREGDAGNKKRYAGTPAYMSPEQARGEGHRVDGRSDIFSLGVVFYELLVGRKPFRGDSREELLEQVTSHDPRPPRQYDEKLPKELERICNKAMAKRASERYSSAYDFAEDLRHFLAENSTSQSNLTNGDLSQSPSATHESDLGTTPASYAATTHDSIGQAISSHNQPIRIVPKGLRSFDANDSDFFLELLPGPRDRDGLPDSLRFWKTQIEVADPDDTFSVGVIYGPSGCGKSSLVKAGLLPRLSPDVVSVYVESTPDDTESRLLNGLRKQCPRVDSNLSLKETLGALRQGQGIPVDKKVLIVLDQFEQWLHSTKREKNTELVQALRQCDGGRVQCIVMVRDDFWMALTRFLNDLEVDLVQGSNFAVVDLFPVRHARKVLAAFGRAYQALPENAGEMTKEQLEFIKQSAAGLAFEDNVISVRLALFAEMMKGKAWEPSTLKAVGGTAGVGITFLDETFSEHSNPKHRVHEKAARAVLNALLPDSGTNIKGTMKSRAELLQASGYEGRAKEFDELIRILDGEIRLITPTDPDGMDPENQSPDLKSVSQQYYQLAHDYLVPSLREWLTRKQKETRRGRAEILLDERSKIWNTKQENRLLPSWWEYPNIRLFTNAKNWTQSQQRMMRQASRVHLVHLAIFGSMLALVIFAGFALAGRVEEQRKRDVAQALVTRVMDAEIAQVPNIVREISEYREWADGQLTEQISNVKDGSPEKLRLALALLPVDDKQVEYLTTAVTNADAQSLPVIRNALQPHSDSMLPSLWQLLHSEEESAERRFNAAAVLAAFDTNADEKWAAVLPFVGEQLVETLTRNPRDFVSILQAMEPIGDPLSGTVSKFVRDGNRGELQRETALNVALEYSANNPSQLAELLAYSEQWQFSKVFERLQKHKSEVVPQLIAILNEDWTEETSELEKERIAKRLANTGIALLHLNEPGHVWPMLKDSEDPRARSYLIHWAAPLGVAPQMIADRISTESDPSTLAALMMALGEFNKSQFTSSQRSPLIMRILTIFENHPEPGVHASSQWLLRKWESEVINDSEATDPDEIRDDLLHAGHLKTVEEVSKALESNENHRQQEMKSGRRRWYVTSQGLAFAMLKGDVFLMGSPPSEQHRNEEREQRHEKQVDRDFAIAMHEVTRDQYNRFYEENKSTIKILRTEQYGQTGDSPQLAVSWYDAAAYCNWLSGEEGIPESEWCYEKNADGMYAEGMKPKENFLELTGYRLPTEAEWEFACRAGTTTSRYYGFSEDLLPKYARFRNAGIGVLPVGSLKPNSFGLFDMFGNAMEWCNNELDSYPDSTNAISAVGDDTVGPAVTDAEPRVLRGGAFLNLPALIRSANRVNYGPANQYYTLGFRPARTLR